MKARKENPLRVRLKAVFASEFVRHVATLLTGTVAAQALMLVLTPVLSRLYTPEDYGLFSIYSSILSTLTVIAALRYDMAIMLPKSDTDAKVLKRGVTLLILATSVVATLVCAFLGGMIANAFSAPALAPWLALMGLSVFSLSEITALSYWLNRKKDYKTIGINKVLLSSGTGLAQLGLALTKLGGIGGLILGSLFGQLVALLRLRQRSRESRQGLEDATSSLKELLYRYRRMPLLNGPNALVDSARSTGMSLLIAALYSGAVLGQFYMAWRLLQIPIALINGAISQVFFQKLSITPRGRMYPFVRAAVVRSALLGIVPFVLIYLLSPWIFPFFLGGQWQLAASIAQALVPWLFLNLITSPISTIFIVTETQHWMLAHATVYAAIPLTLIPLLQGDIVWSLTVMSWAMAGWLVVFIFMALWVSRKYDLETVADGPATTLGLDSAL
ncbi:MAG: oligosaccharide flippase family protein [Specibacter sp.]